MRALKLFLVSLALAASASAVTMPQLRYYLLVNGAPEPVALGSRATLIQTGDQIEASHWDPTLPAFPGASDLVPQSAADAVYSIPAAYLAASNGVLVEISDEAKAELEAEAAAEAAAAEAARQAAKPVERKFAENTYFDLCATILAAVSDPRATNVPPVKLTIPELNTALDAISNVDFEGFTKLSLKLLAVNSALIRYHVLWWEDAAYHPEIVAP